MTESVLNDLDVDSCFHHPRCEGMSQIVATEVRKKHRRCFGFFKLFGIAVSYDSFQSSIERVFVIYRTVSVEEDEIRVIIYGNVAGQSDALLIKFSCSRASLAKSIRGTCLTLEGVLGVVIAK